VVNLKGKTLTPGFIDSHSHFSMTAVVQSLGFSISPPPFGSVSNIPQMLQNAKDYITSKRIPAGQKVFGAGYNDYLLAERRHPTRYELDWISTEHPIVFQHFSAHVVVANSLAISLLNITD
jgi:predicted amidohydrolase YtcJ